MALDLIRDHVLSMERSSGQLRTTCPACTPSRKKKREKSLSIRFDGDVAIFNCFHCEEKGAVSLVDEVVTGPVPEPSVSLVESGLSEAQLEWFETRGITSGTTSRCNLTRGSIYIGNRSGRVLCIGFPYENADGTSATKWRDRHKNWSQTGAARSLWRINQWDSGDLVITEGEVDALSFEEIDVFATSVPNGAPSQRSVGANGSDVKYSYLWDAKDQIEKASRIILALDADEPGRILSEEIARRVGKGRCWKLQYPDGCKDANDVLVGYGPEKLREVLVDATPWPVSGLRDVSEYRSEILSLHDKGFESGMALGIPELDEIFRVCPQTLTICTGIPGVGKSAFLSWVSVELARKFNAPVAVLSAETPPVIHLLQASAIHQKKPYKGSAKMSTDDINESLDWLGERFVILDESDTQIESVLERAQAAVLRMGVRILIIDPYNFLTGSVGGAEEGSVQGINRLLTNLKNFSVQFGVSTFLVAHPVKMFRGQDGSTPVPTGYDVSGSAAFFGIADLGISVSRREGGRSLITVWKARFPWVGKPGEVELNFDMETGVYSSVMMPSASEDLDDGWFDL